MYLFHLDPNSQGKHKDAVKGQIAEQKMFDALKQYFDGCKDDVVVVHSHKFLNKDSNNEKDFIILNLTKGYILVIEVKANQSKYQKAKKQLFDSKDRCGEIFGALGYPAGWKYGGVFLHSCVFFCPASNFGQNKMEYGRYHHQKGGSCR